MINTERRLVKMDTAAKTQQSFHGTNQITFSIRDSSDLSQTSCFFGKSISNKRTSNNKLRYDFLTRKVERFITIHNYKVIH